MVLVDIRFHQQDREAELLGEASVFCGRLVALVLLSLAVDLAVGTNVAALHIGSLVVRVLLSQCIVFHGTLNVFI